jgi:hypothetical protein
MTKRDMAQQLLERSRVLRATSERLARESSQLRKELVELSERSQEARRRSAHAILRADLAAKLLT